MLNKKIQVNLNENFSGEKENNSARGKSIKIALIYFLIGCSWILFTDKLVQGIFETHSNIPNMVMFSIIKGLFYVLITAMLVFWLIYPQMKKAIDSREEIKRAYKELEKSNHLYEELNLELSREQGLLRALIDSIPDLVFYKSNDFIYLGCNKAFEVFVGKPESEIIGRTDFDLFDSDAAQLFRNMDIEMMKTNTAKVNEETITYPSGEKACLETIKGPYFDLNGDILGLIGVSRNITERKMKEEEIRYLNYHDVLTGVYNRAFLHKQLIELDNEEHLPLSVIFGDINGMKLINDAFGHAEGDNTLIEIADILKQHCRKSDIICRVGGDEFSILLPKTDIGVAKSIVEDIREECRSRKQNRNSIHADIALGFATKNNLGESFNETIVYAEDLMFRRKLLENQSLHSSILSSIKATMFEKSNETEAHAERLAELSKKLGEKIGLSAEKLDELELVATLHDIGKISIDKNILTKADKLSFEEWHEIKKHPEAGYRIAYSLPELRHIAEFILSHHERWDGNGYPQGLSGENIPLLSRIVSIIDAYDAMTQDRAYRKAMSAENAMKEIISNAGTQFDPELVKIFAEVAGEGPLPVFMTLPQLTLWDS